MVLQNMEVEINSSMVFEIAMGSDPEPQEERSSVLRKIVF